jgi:hypothetical protein
LASRVVAQTDASPTPWRLEFNTSLVSERKGDNSVGIAASLQVGWSGVRIPLGKTKFSLTQWVMGSVSGGKAAPEVKLAAHLYVEPRLRMSGAISLFHLCAFVAWSLPILLYQT